MPRPLTRGADPVQSLRARGDEGPDGVASQRPRLLNGRAILVATLVLVAGASSAQSDQAAIGRKVPDFRFANVVLNGDGYPGGDAYLGRPVLYEFWGFR